MRAGPATPPPGAMPLAVRREPSTPEPPSWGDRIVPDYERHIQPIFDRHCVRVSRREGARRRPGIHVAEDRRIYAVLPDAVRSEARATPTPFAKNYWSIWRPNEPAISNEAARCGQGVPAGRDAGSAPAQLVTVADYTGGSEVTEPRQFGSASSKLTLTLLEDALHRDEVKLSRDEWISLVTWVDLNAQYWGTFVEKDGHYASRRAKGPVVPPRRVDVVFPDPWAPSTGR